MFQPIKKVSTSIFFFWPYSIFLLVKTTQLSSLIDSNKEIFKKIKAHLNVMKSDIEESIEKYGAEPETRVKKTVHVTFTLKFREVLRVS